MHFPLGNGLADKRENCALLLANQCSDVWIRLSQGLLFEEKLGFHQMLFEEKCFLPNEPIFPS